MYNSVIDMDFILSRESIKFDIGLDHLPYAIFSDNCYSVEYHDLIGGHGIGHWANYENAVCLQITIGL